MDFPLSKINLMWKRWSGYAIKRYQDVDYVVPVPDAELVPYDCAEQPEAMVADALELGRRIHQGTVSSQDYLDFAAAYGLLGLGGPRNTKNNPAPDYQSRNSKKYGEATSAIDKVFLYLYAHFFESNVQSDGVRIKLQSNNITDDALFCGAISYRLTDGNMPRLIWQLHTLQDVLRIAYAAMITAPEPAIKICKNCGRIYYNTHNKSEFCSARCRSAYNVRAFRDRKMVEALQAAIADYEGKAAPTQPKKDKPE